MCMDFFLKKMYKNALHVSLVPSDIRRGCWSPWIIVTNSCEPSDDMGHLKKQPVPLKWGCLDTGADIQREPNGEHKTKVTWAQSKAYKIARSWEAILGRRVLLDTAEGAQPCPTAICGLGNCEHTHFSTVEDLTIKCGSMLTLWEGLHWIGVANVN